MYLSNITKEKLMNIRDYYEIRKQQVDMNFIHETIKVIQKDGGFGEIFQCEFVEDKRGGPAYVYHKNMYFQMDLFMKYVEKNAKDWFVEYPYENMPQYRIFLAFLVILHECSHVWQMHGLEKFSEINRLYSDIMSDRTLRLKSLKDIIHAIKLQINARKSSYRDCFERHANIDAFKELIDMYQDYSFLDFIELQHVYYLSFQPKGESIVHDTLKKFDLNFNYDCSGIPQDLLFEVGLPTNKQYSDSVYAAIEQYNQEELSYEKVMEKVKKCE